MGPNSSGPLQLDLLATRAPLTDLSGGLDFMMTVLRTCKAPTGCIETPAAERVPPGEQQLARRRGARPCRCMDKRARVATPRATVATPERTARSDAPKKRATRPKEPSAAAEGAHMAAAGISATIAKRSSSASCTLQPKPVTSAGNVCGRAGAGPGAGSGATVAVAVDGDSKASSHNPRLAE